MPKARLTDRALGMRIYQELCGRKSAKVNSSPDDEGMGVLQDGRVVRGGRSSTAPGAARAVRLEVEEVDHLPHLRHGERRVEQGGGLLHGPGIHTLIMPGQAPVVVRPYATVHRRLKAARIWGIVCRSEAAGLVTPTDRGYVGAGRQVLLPYKGMNKPTS